MATYNGIDDILNQKSGIQQRLFQTMARQNPMPLDSTEVFSSYMSAQSYAKGLDIGNKYQNGALAYVGQKITVIDKELSSADTYMITDQAGTLLKMSDQDDLDELKESISYNKSSIDTLGKAVDRVAANTKVDIRNLIGDGCDVATIQWNTLSTIDGYNINPSLNVGDSNGQIAVFGTGGIAGKNTCSPYCGRIYFSDSYTLSSAGNVTLNVYQHDEEGKSCGEVSSYVATCISSAENPNAGKFMCQGVRLGDLSAEDKFTAIKYHNSKWYAAYSDMVFVADDDTFSSWTQIFQIPEVGYGIYTLESIGETMYICGQTNGIWRYTIDGEFIRMDALMDAVEEYVRQTGSTDTLLYWDIETIGNTYVVTTNFGMFYSDNFGKSWSRSIIYVETQESIDPNTWGFATMASSGKRVVARASRTLRPSQTSYDYSGRAFYSDDGKVFYECAYPSSRTTIPNNLYYFDNVWYALYTKNDTYVSYDGKTWQYDKAVGQEISMSQCVIRIRERTLVGKSNTYLNVTGIRCSSINRSSCITDTVEYGSTKLITSGGVFNSTLTSDYTSFEVFPTVSTITAGTSVQSNIESLPIFDSSVSYSNGQCVRRYIDEAWHGFQALQMWPSSGRDEQYWPGNNESQWKEFIDGEYSYGYNVLSDDIESFCIKTGYKKSDLDIVIDWGDGDVTTLKDATNLGLTSLITDQQLESYFAEGATTVVDWHGGNPDTSVDGELKSITVAHKYNVQDNNSKFIVKIYGTRYDALRHCAENYFVDLSNCSVTGKDIGNRNAKTHNLISRILGNDLQIYSGLTNAASFCLNADKLLYVNMEKRRNIIPNVYNVSSFFAGCRNLVKLYGMKWFLLSKNLMECEGFLCHCYSVKSIDVILNKSIGYSKTRSSFRGNTDDTTCRGLQQLTSDVLDLIPPNGFVNSYDSFASTFASMSSLTCSDYTKLGKLLWNNPLAETWTGTNCFSGCQSMDLWKIPVEWGGIGGFQITYANGTEQHKNGTGYSILKSTDCSLSSDGAKITLDNQCDYRDTVDELLKNSENVVEFNSSCILSVGNSAFGGCKNLSSVSLQNVELIREFAFYGCTELKYCNNMDKVEEMQTGAFAECSSIGSLSAQNLKRTGNSTFLSCKQLSSVYIPNAEYLDTATFQFCIQLSAVDISNVKTIGFGVFRGCSSLTSVNCENLLCVIPCSYGTRTFSGCTKLSTIEFPNIMEIGEQEFSEHSISQDSTWFSSCTQLRTVVCPKADRVGQKAFYGCVNLELVDFSGRTKSSIPVLDSENAFGNTNDTYIIRVPAFLYNDWIADGTWSKIASHIQSA